MKTIKELAGELSDALEWRVRGEDQNYVALKDGSPEWMTEVIRAAHGDKMPDDTTYEFCKKCAEAIAEAEEGEEREAIMEIEADIYTHDLTGWLHARADHVYYLTEAIEQFGRDIGDGFKLLMYAQHLHIQEVGNELIAALTEQAEKVEA
jgi:hypothetical protein